jgi:ribonucleoside-diphosphate reductase alpha chain
VNDTIYSHMKIIKRDGKKETVNFQKVYSRINKLTYKLNSKFVDSHEVARKVINGLYDGVTSKEIDTLAAETSAALIADHPDYSILAARLAISAHHKETSKSFSETITKLYNYVDPKTGERARLVSDEVYDVVTKHAQTLDEAIIYDRDFLIDYFGFKTLSRSYLLKMDDNVVERIQHMWMRVSVGIWKDNIEEVIATYELMSEKWGTHATPTLFNAGTVRPQMSSCFLMAMADDSIKGIYKTLSNAADISQHAGGLGIHIHNIRAKGSYIKGTGGISNGIVPMLQNFNATARYVDQGGGKRKGSFAIYLEPWHADIFDFLDLKKPHGKEENRARDLFLAVWTPDLFFERLLEDGDWTLFCPKEAPGLADVYGDEFKALYERYESEGLGRRTIKASRIMEAIIESQTETGVPYMLSKDNANMKSNQKNLGTIKSSNLCCEIMEVSTPDETAVCNLASLALSMYVRDGKIDHDKLYDVTYQLTKNLNQVIDVNYYPTPETKVSNMRHRPIGLGVQGFADMLAQLKLSFTSEGAKTANKEVFETIYFAAMSASNDGAKKRYEAMKLTDANIPTTAGAYESFVGSPLSKGIFQFDMWENRSVANVDGKFSVVDREAVTHSGRWDWATLRQSVMTYGALNSLLLAPMPTASTAQILGNNEMFEPFTSNIMVRGTASGEFIVVNKYLVNELVELNLWTEAIKNKVVVGNGSVQDIEEIPLEVRERYKTIWEIKQKDLIDLAADRGVYICQSQSMNLYVGNITKSGITTAIIYGWLKGLKTLNYYIRSKAAVGAIKGLGMESSNSTESGQAPISNAPEECDVCSA